ncbi:MAG: hypothetical protein ACXVIH_14580, partial [Ilumatobacteraceae bacterium]
APPFTSVAYGDGTWIAVGNGIHQYGETSMTYRSTDGTHWTRQNDTGLNSQTDSRIAFGSGQWALGGQALSPTGSQGVYPDGVVSVSTDTTTWTSDPGAQFVHNKIAGVAYGNGQWLAVGQDGDHPVGYHRNPSSAFFASSDAKTWTRRGHLDPEGWDLAFGGGPTASGPTAPPTAAPASTTTTTQSASGLASIDFRNYSYEDQVCGTHKLVHLANGSWRQDPTNTSNYCGMSINSVAFADVTGDGVADAIVSGSGSAGGTALGLVTWTTVFAGSPTGPANLGYFSGLAYPPYSTSQGITLWSQRLGPNDPACCPSSYQKTTYKYSNSTAKFTATGSTIVPASQLPKG